MPSSNLAAFREEFKKAKRGKLQIQNRQPMPKETINYYLNCFHYFLVVVLTGAGVSAESGVPTFRGAGGFWREFQAQQLATPEAFEEDPSLVWEFYHYRREVMLEKQPNPAHLAIAQAEKKLKELGKRLIVITQNIDELHKRAGSENILELHGSLFRVRCTRCGEETSNYDSPICEALRDKGKPDPNAGSANIPVKDLPTCKSCGGLLRPAVVWFGEGLNHDVLGQAHDEIEECDVCMVVGTSSVVYPAAMFAPMVSISVFHFDNYCLP